MATVVEAYLGIFGPPTDKKGLCIWRGEKVVNTIGQILWQPIYQAFVIDEVMNNPPAITITGNTIYAFYPSSSNQTSYLYYNTGNATTLEWSDQQIVTFYDPLVSKDIPVETSTGAGAATFNGQVYVFWQGVSSSGTGNSSNETLFYRTMSNTACYQINPQQSVDGSSAGAVMTNCPSAVVFNNLLYVFYRGPSSISNAGPWYTYSSDGSTWSSSTAVPNVAMASSPSTVVFTDPSSGEEKLYVFHEGEGGGSPDHELFYFVMDTSGNCSGDTQVPNVSMSAVPSAGIYDGMIYVFYQGSNTSTFWYVYSSDGSTWSEPYQVATLKISYAPSIVEFNSKIYLLMQGPGNDKILWFATLVPGSTPAVVPMTALPNGANSTQRGPSTIVFNGNLCCFVESPSIGGALLVSSLGDAGWSGQDQIFGGGTMSSAPSAVVFGPYAYVFFQGSNNSLQSYIWKEWDSPVQVPNANMTSSPSAVVFNEQLYVFYNTTANTVAYSISNVQGGQGSSWSNVNTVPINTENSGINNSVAPFAVVFNDELYIFYMGAPPSDASYHNALSYYKLSASGEWSDWCGVPDSTGWSEQNGGNFSPGPAAGAFVSTDNVLYIVYQNGSGELYYVSTTSGDSISGWTAPVELSNQVPQATPPTDGQVTDWTINLGFFLAS
ncbi:hypothetical protein SAMN05660489_01781 [Pseudomonas sp. LAMO17WK12:I10]|uniref:hypothetical protein n=1 Tax=unclassified Pseudomonas TaxID=196821 RepID=UPI000BCB8704|nr:MULTISPECIES: hypothetical protein [unclassified Pseudomonas]PXX73976.1 hypothetical protein H160_01865 [Pseudomonas sp. LAMO17WK12:I9]SNY23353.1 hypothetical protein SAMN05660489_01781 [Pseudomonas sp. LAMO17WK12:I10]